MTSKPFSACLLLLIAALAGCPQPGPRPSPPPLPRADMGAEPDQDDLDQSDSDLDDRDGGSVDSSGDLSLADFDAEMECEVETTLQFCMRNNYMCGELVAEDNCGQMRTEVCGEACSLPETCLALSEEEEEPTAITSTACGCDVENVAEVCAQVGKLCGALAPPCAEMRCDNFCVDSVAAGSAFNCALGSGTLRCWGENRGGQLGIDSTTTEKNPVALKLELKVREVAAGDAHSCAILDDTSLICWGLNDHGQLGISTTVNQPFPNLADPNSRAIARGVHKIALGAEHTCALVDDDFDPTEDVAPAAPFSAYCWGSNDLGVVGNPERIILGADAGAPVLVKGLKDNVIDLAAGFGHNCAIIEVDPSDRAQRQVRCWGLDDGGQLGARDILSGQIYELDAMGRRVKTEVPDPSDPDKTILVEIPLDRYHHYMANEPENNRKVVILAPALVRADRPATMVADAPHPNAPLAFTGELEEIVAGRSVSCVRDANQQVSCWGLLPFDHDSLSCRIPLEAPIDALTVDRCTAWPPTALWDEVTVPMIKRVGMNTTAYGLPSGSFQYRAVAPRPVIVTHHPDDPTVYPSYAMGGEAVSALQMSAHTDHICLVLDDQEHLPDDGSEPGFTNVHCFGDNAFGQLGDSSTSPIGYPIKITEDINAEIVRALQVSVGTAHTCAVADDNNIKCWGSNKESQLGNENILRDESLKPYDVLLR